MKVILSKDIAGLGRKGQIKEVSDGHARNFLIPRHLALPATSSTLAQVQKEESEREQKIKRQEEYARDARKKLEGKTFEVTGKAEGSRLFAAIHPEEIARIMRDKTHLAIEPKQVIIKQAIKSLGEHEVEIKFSDTINAKVKVKVEKE